MRYWRVLVESSDGRRFSTRALEISASRVILRGEHALSTGMMCELQIVVPSQDEKCPATMAGLRAEVGEVVFASGNIRLDFRVKSLSDEARELIDSRRAG